MRTTSSGDELYATDVPGIWELYRKGGSFGFEVDTQLRGDDGKTHRIVFRAESLIEAVKGLNERRRELGRGRPAALAADAGTNQSGQIIEWRGKRRTVYRARWVDASGERVCRTVATTINGVKVYGGREDAERYLADRLAEVDENLRVLAEYEATTPLKNRRGKALRKHERDEVARRLAATSEKQQRAAAKRSGLEELRLLAVKMSAAFADPPGRTPEAREHLRQFYPNATELEYAVAEAIRLSG